MQGSTGLPHGSSGLPMSAADSMLPGAASMLPGGSIALDAAAVDPAAAAAAAAAAPVPAGASGKTKGKSGKAGKHTTGGNQLSRPRKPLEATLLDLRTNRHMLRLMPPLSAAAAAAGNAGDQAGDQAAAAAAAAGDRAAAAALAPARQWGSSNSSGLRLCGMQGSVRGFGSSSSRDQQAVLDPEAAAAAEALQIKHVPDLLSQEFRPVLPDGDDWLADIVWDRDEAAAAADEATAAAEEQGVAGQQLLQQHALEKQVSNVDKLIKASQQQQQQLMNNSGQLMRLGPGRAADGVLARRSRVVWDLNDPHMVFEAPATSQYSNASAVVQQAAPKVGGRLRRGDMHCCSGAQNVVHQ
jgi:hypothetical protein